MSRKSILDRIIDEDDKYINFEHVLKYIAIADNVNNANGEEADIYTIARFLLYLADVKATLDDSFAGNQ
ncbi:MAG: hypothetical protein Q4C79_01085 [Neisseria sp.]|uniref:hypothetical protein n=1 Tax=Neisseria sp. TaxID=192066 RepID=UPI0026DBE3EE|nr:hypothetical protein [Neisseria sp.]MDO4247553.1 hypothetical protein [Neisseria sp.]